MSERDETLQVMLYKAVLTAARTVEADNVPTADAGCYYVGTVDESLWFRVTVERLPAAKPASV